MKILFVHPSVELYGADKILLYMLKMLSGRNHELTVLVPKDGVLLTHIRDISAQIKIIVDEKLPIAHSKLGVKDYFCLSHRIWQVGKRFPRKSFDIVYCNTLATVLLLYTRWGKARVAHVHEIIENPALNFAFSILVRMRTKNVICVSKRVKENLLFSKKYAVVHNGIPDMATSAVRNSISGKVLFALPGRFMPKKGQWFLLGALKRLPKAYLDKMHISLYGSPPPNRMELQAELEKQVQESGLQSVIAMHPFETDISKIYMGANVILVPSLMADPFPTTVLEALMFARPVITTDNGGAVEILDDSYARIIKPNDEQAFADALIYFVDNAELIPEMGALARKKYEDYLTLEMFGERFLHFLK